MAGLRGREVWATLQPPWLRHIGRTPDFPWRGHLIFRVRRAAIIVNGSSRSSRGRRGCSHVDASVSTFNSHALAATTVERADRPGAESRFAFAEQA